jgi:hypothetical protein
MDNNLEKKEALRANLPLKMNIEAVNLLMISKNDRALESLLKNEEISDQIKLIICEYFVERRQSEISSEKELDILVGNILCNITKNNNPSSQNSQIKKNIYNEKMDKSEEEKGDCMIRSLLGYSSFAMIQEHLQGMKRSSERNEGSRNSDKKSEGEISKENINGIPRRIVNELGAWGFWIEDTIIMQIENIIIAIDAISLKYAIHWRGGSLDGPIEGTLTTFESICEEIFKSIGWRKEALFAKKEALVERNERTGYSDNKNEADISKEDTDKIPYRLVNELGAWNFWFNDLIIIQKDILIIAIDPKSGHYKINWRGMFMAIQGTLTTFESIVKEIFEVIQEQKEAQIPVKKAASSERNEQARYSDEKNEANISKEDAVGIAQRIVRELDAQNFWVSDIIIIQKGQIIIVIDTKSVKYMINHKKIFSMARPLTTFESIRNVLHKINQ